MITLYSGTPGSGKSLHCAERLYYRLRQFKPCICNFYVNVSKIFTEGKNKDKPLPFYMVDNCDLTPELLINFSHEWFKNHKFREGAILLVIDECQLMFQARDWQKTGRATWLSFFSQHRKYGYDIILIAQFDRMIDRQIRALIEYEWIHRKVSNMGKKGKLFSIWSGNNLFVCVKMWYPMKEKVSSEFFTAKKKYYQLYDTYSLFA